MDNLDINIYKRMENLKEHIENNKYSEVADIIFIGSIDWMQKDLHAGANIKTKKDIFISVEKSRDGKTIFKYYDDEKNLLAIDFNDARGIMPTEKSQKMLEYFKENGVDDLDFLSQFRDLGTTGISLDETNTELEKVAKELNLSKEQILSISKVESAKQEEKDKDKEKKIKLKEDKDAKTSVEESNKEKKEEASKANPNIKQETDLSQKVNEKYTLGDILGVPEGGKLVAVYSDAVENNTNSSRFTFLLQDKDGNFSRLNNLEQVAGTHPTNNVYASNYDGSDVTKDDVNSMYKIKSPFSNENYVLTARIGSMGTIDLGLGQAPRFQGINDSQTSLVTIPLKTNQTYNTKPEVKNELLAYHSEYGRSAADVRVKEANSHNDNCKLTMDEIDGDPNTGHNHDSYKEEHDNKLDDTKNLSDKEIDDALNDLFNERGKDEFFSYENFKADFIETYLDGNTNQTRDDFESACNNYKNERYLGPNRDNRN